MVKRAFEESLGVFEENQGGSWESLEKQQWQPCVVFFYKLVFLNGHYFSSLHLCIHVASMWLENFINIVCHVCIHVRLYFFCITPYFATELLIVDEKQRSILLKKYTNNY